MGDWSLLPGRQTYESGVDAAATGTLVTMNGGADTKGPWSELIAATAHPSSLLVVHIGYRSASGQDALFDIGIGAAASETVLISNLQFSMTPGYSAPVRYQFPIHIPAGVRLSIRGQTGFASSATAYAAIQLGHKTFNEPDALSEVITYGANTADSGGTSIDPGAAANTKGAWTEITASTTKPIRSLCMALGSQENTVRTVARVLLDIGIGAGGSELVVIPDCWFLLDVTNDSTSPSFLGPYDLDIPAGVRLAARAACTITDATDRLFDLVVYGVS